MDSGWLPDLSIVPLRQLGEIALGQISCQMTVLAETKPIERHDYFCYFCVVVHAEGATESNADSTELTTPISQHIFDLSDFLACTCYRDPCLRACRLKAHATSDRYDR